MSKVEQWDVFELAVNALYEGNAYQDVYFGARFENGDEWIETYGFYDGGDRFVLRFMPQNPGNYTYRTFSNFKPLDGLLGEFVCTPAGPGNHGMVKVAAQYHFAYSDSTPYYPFGTTSYGWAHQPDEDAQRTVDVLALGDFNKIRMCILPHYSAHSARLIPSFPFVQTQTRDFDFKTINPAYFQMIDRRVEALRAIGVEADLILLHPYNKQWGFHEIPLPDILNYARYVVARYGAYRNVWWSLANEYDLLRSLTQQDWDEIGYAVASHDPYGHLLSCHQMKKYFPNWKSYITHACVQDELSTVLPGRAAALRTSWGKPVIFDEVCYEGNFADSRWGNLTAKELVDRFYRALTAGTYCGHGEVLMGADREIVWTGVGQILNGESAPRIGFLKKLMQERLGWLEPLDKWWRVDFAFRPDVHYTYLGMDAPKEVPFMFPYRTMGAYDGARYRVTVVDGWNMTAKTLNTVYVAKAMNEMDYADEQGRTIPLPEHGLVALIFEKLPEA